MARSTKRTGGLDDADAEIEVLSAADLADWRQRQKHPKTEPDPITELIGAAIAGQDRDNEVRRYWAATRRRFVATMGREPRRNRGAWTTTAGHVKQLDSRWQAPPRQAPGSAGGYLLPRFHDERSEEAQVLRVEVVVIGDGLNVVEIPGLAGLAWQEEADLVHGRPQTMGRVAVG